MSTLSTPSLEQQFRAYQRARGVDRQSKSSSSPQEVILRHYGLPSRTAVENFLKHNTLSTPTFFHSKETGVE